MTNKRMIPTTYTQLSVDPEDIDVESRSWEPTEFQFAGFKRRDLQLARHNASVLAKTYEPRGKVTITNGLEEGKGYHAIGVIVGGPEAEDALHNPLTFGSATTFGMATAHEYVQVNISADPEVSKILTLRNWSDIKNDKAKDKSKRVGS